MRAGVVLGIMSVCLKMGGGSMVPVPSLETELNSMPEPELEGLLHMAIRHSNLTLLREMAANADKSNSSARIAELMHALHESDRLLREAIVNVTTGRDGMSEDDLIAGLLLLEQYGDHLVDKADLLDKQDGLEPLLQWFVTFRLDDERYTRAVLEHLCSLVVEMTQNRHEGKILVLKHQPRIVEIVYMSMVKQWNCMDSDKEDEACSALARVIQSLLGNSEYLQAQVDLSVLVPFADALGQIASNRELFVRLVSLLKTVSLNVGKSTRWAAKVDVVSLLNAVGTVRLSVGEQIISLVSRMADRGGVAVDLDAMAKAHSALYTQCVGIRGDDGEWCMQYKLVENLSHSTEL